MQQFICKIEISSILRLTHVCIKFFIFKQEGRKLVDVTCHIVNLALMPSNHTHSTTPI